VKKSLALAIVLASTGTLANASTFNGKTMAMSDTGVATSDYLEGLNLNPAALANFGDSDDFNFHINAGALGADEDDLLDNAEQLVDMLDVVDGFIPSIDYVNDLVAQLQAINGKAAVVDAGGGLYMNIPTGLVSLGLTARTSLTAGVMANVDEADIDYLENAANNLTPVDAALLNSSINAIGAAVTDTGLTFARRFGVVSVGVTPKYQTVEIIDYTANVDSFDEDDLDADDYTTEDSNFNLDLGVQGQFGSWRLGATLSNALEQDYQSIDGREVTIEPLLTVGGGYRNGWFTAALDVDANSTPNLITSEESRFARAGMELNAWGWLQLRAGYKKDLESVFEDTVSVGVGFSPFGVLNVDLAAVSGDDDTKGAALQLGFSF
jgi:hypothetical protein